MSPAVENGLDTHSYEKLHPLEVPPALRPRIYGWNTKSGDGYQIKETPSGVERPMKIIAVGIGASGINFAKFQQDQLKNVEFTVYDKNHEVSGTWIENRYPGCACDIPSVTYQYTWEPKIWSKYYSDATEIFDYFRDIVDKYNLRKYIKLRHEVKRAEWDASRGKWVVEVENLEDGSTFKDECDVFLNSGGILNFWQWPNIKGLKDYQGIIAHTAAYPQGLDLKGKRVAVVGTGSSGIQIVANIQKEVEHLYTWVRTSTWITAGYASQHAGPNGENFEYSEAQKKRFAEDPEYYLKYRKEIEYEMSDPFLVHKNTPISNSARDYAKKEMMTKLQGRESLLQAMIPQHFTVGCKRPTPGNGYLEALSCENVTVFTDASFDQVTPKGFIDQNGKEVEVDVIILATGFNTTWVPRFPIVANGKNLQDIYTRNPLSYFGVAAAQMPNYFTFYGPYGPLGQGSVLPMIECFSNYIIKVIKKMQVENIKSITPKIERILDYGQHADAWLKRTVWDGPCRSWMKGGKLEGKPMVYCGTRAQFMELLESPRYEDYEIAYGEKNAYTWLGNGFTQRDIDGRDITWYMGLVDGLDKQKNFDVSM